jgi:hypothetical protein
MYEILFALALLFNAAGEPRPNPQGWPKSEVTFCNFALSSGIKRANASFYVSYSFTIDETGKPTNITKVRNDYVGENQILSCLKEWNFPGVQKGAIIVAIFRWQHSQGWVELSITGEGLNQKIKLTGDRCPYSGARNKSN